MHNHGILIWVAFQWHNMLIYHQPGYSAKDSLTCGTVPGFERETCSGINRNLDSPRRLTLA